MTKRIVGVSGSLSLNSKTQRLVETIVDAAARHTGARTTVIPLLPLAPLLTAAHSRAELATELRAAFEAVETADLLVVGSPVYKGTYTGLFKYFFDFIDRTALQGHAVALTATGGGDRHALVVEHQLRPLFGFFGARTLPTSFFASDRDFVDGAIGDPGQRARLDQLIREARDVIGAQQIAAA
jgi:FMN reductase